MTSAQWRHTGPLRPAAPLSRTLLSLQATRPTVYASRPARSRRSPLPVASDDAASEFNPPQKSTPTYLNNIIPLHNARFREVDSHSRVQRQLQRMPHRRDYSDYNNWPCSFDARFPSYRHSAFGSPEKPFRPEVQEILMSEMGLPAKKVEQLARRLKDPTKITGEDVATRFFHLKKLLPDSAVPYMVWQCPAQFLEYSWAETLKRLDDTSRLLRAALPTYAPAAFEEIPWLLFESPESLFKMLWEMREQGRLPTPLPNRTNETSVETLNGLQKAKFQKPPVFGDHNFLDTRRQAVERSNGWAPGSITEEIESLMHSMRQNVYLGKYLTDSSRDRKFCTLTHHERRMEQILYTTLESLEERSGCEHVEVMAKLLEISRDTAVEILCRCPAAAALTIQELEARLVELRRIFPRAIAARILRTIPDALVVGPWYRTRGTLSTNSAFLRNMLVSTGILTPEELEELFAVDLSILFEPLEVLKAGVEELERAGLYNLISTSRRIGTISMIKFSRAVRAYGYEVLRRRYSEVILRETLIFGDILLPDEVDDLFEVAPTILFEPLDVLLAVVDEFEPYYFFQLRTSGRFFMKKFARDFRERINHELQRRKRRAQGNVRARQRRCSPSTPHNSN